MQNKRKKKHFFFLVLAAVQQPNQTTGDFSLLIYNNNNISVLFLFLKEKLRVSAFIESQKNGTPSYYYKMLRLHFVPPFQY